MTLYRIYAEIEANNLENIEHMLSDITKRHQVKFSITTIDPTTRCCDRAVASNGWHHDDTCENFVLVY